VINTIDVRFFIENIRHGYDERKSRHDNMSDKPITMAQEMYNLVMNSNQIVHNRGRALAYLGNAHKKRKEVPTKPRHQYDLAVSEPAQRGFGGNPFLKGGKAVPKYNDSEDRSDQVFIQQDVKRRRQNDDIVSQHSAHNSTVPQ